LLEVHVAVWLVMALPLSAPRVNFTFSELVDVMVAPALALTPVGAPGEPTITGPDALEAVPVPAALLALTVQV
jgi:hypothetical protein